MNQNKFLPDAATIDTGKIGTKTNFPPDTIKSYQSIFPQKQPQKKNAATEEINNSPTTSFASLL